MPQSPMFANVFSLRAARDKRPLTPAQLRQRDLNDRAARLRWVRFKADALATIATADERSAEDPAYAKHLGEEIQRLLDLFEAV